MSKGLSKAGLEKGLQQLEQAARTPAQARAAELFAKAQEGTITPEEREELIKSVNTDLASQVTAPLTNNETMQKSLNVSDYLREQHSGIVTALSTLAERIQKSEGSEHEFRVALATALVGTGSMLKSMEGRIDGLEELLKGISERLGIIAAQPSRGPKSQAGAAAAATGDMAKSFAGGTTGGGGDGLSKAQLLDGMSDMLMKGQDMVAGESLAMAATKYEATSEISPALYKAVQEHVRGNRPAA